MYWHRFVYSRRANNPVQHQQDLSVSRFSLDEKCYVTIVIWLKNEINCQQMLAGCWLDAGWMLARCWLDAGWMMAGIWLDAGWMLAGCWVAADLG
jgi:hypothetical protein